MEDRKFKVEEDHIQLLKNMRVTWNDLCFGSPTVDPKRPYGSTTVIEDMAKMLNIGIVDKDGEIQLTDLQEKKLLNLHKETETVLEILLYNCSIKPGVYVNKGYSNEWIFSVE
ncbi:hypothetical protein [Paenibacillus sp. FSL L8-0463]|uniref:hypothetical protein n=1 Tax=Paenibacillus sp. FSL L8-0463 TaxID=2954687 RepID=UPI00311A2E02